MESYTNSNPQFSSSINIVETTDPVHADLVNAAPKQLLENILVLLGRLNEHLNDKNNPHNITAENINAIAKSALGVADGVAKLDKDGIVPVENGGTGGSSGITAANSLQVAALAGGAAIAEGTDLDTLTVPGTYAAANAAVAATLLHCPISFSGFVMYTFLTYPYNGGSTYRTQIIICGADTPSSFWIRNFNGSGKWCDWVRMKYTDPTDITGNAATADKLKTARIINGMSFDGSEDIRNFAQCNTAAGVVEKTVGRPGFNLVVGAEITVLFTAANTAANPTLNVNDTGAKHIYYRGGNIPAGYLKANGVYTFRYNGAVYYLVGDIDTNTTYSNATTTAAGLMSAADKTQLSNLPIVCYQGSPGGSSFTKALPAGKTKCLIIMHWGSSSGIDCGAYILTGLSSNMTAVTTQSILLGSGAVHLLYTVTSAGTLTLYPTPNTNCNYTMIYFA